MVGKHSSSTHFADGWQHLGKFHEIHLANGVVVVGGCGATKHFDKRKSPSCNVIYYRLQGLAMRSDSGQGLEATSDYCWRHCHNTTLVRGPADFFPRTHAVSLRPPLHATHDLGHRTRVGKRCRADLHCIRTRHQ